MKDLHKNRLLDKAKLEVGTNVQLFEFTFDDAIISTGVVAVITMIAYFTTSFSADALLSFFGGSALTMLAFYIKFGTN